MLRSHRRIKSGYTDQKIDLNISQTQVIDIKESKITAFAFAFVFVFRFRFVKHSHFDSKDDKKMITPV